MCGICGRYNLDGAEVHRHEMEAMAETMAHRGPDDQGVLIRPGVGLGHRRLSIIDLSGGHQPMSNEDGRVWIAYNGEVYNYPDLQAQLEAKGHTFRTRCDTEALIHGYEEWGPSFVEHTNGMFAFALWDGRAPGPGRLILGRDRLGIKPLYWVRLKSSILFASEIKALAACPDLPLTVDPEAVASYLTFGYMPGLNTLLQGIQRVPPGTIITFDPQGSRQTLTYFHIPVQGPRQTQSQVGQLLSDSVHLRLRSDVPLGVFLSGGVDSSAVVGTLARSGRVTETLRTFCIGFDIPGGVNEFDYARLSARRFHTEHHERILSPAEFLEFLPRMVWYLDEPLSDESAISIYFVSKVSSELVKVVLSGEGSDESFGGYGIYGKMLLLERLHRLLGPVGRQALVPLFALLFRSGLILHPGLRKYFALLSRPLERRYLGVHLFDVSLWDEILHPDFRAGLKNFDPLGQLEPIYQESEGQDTLSRMLHLDQRTWLPNNILLKADKMSMAASIELRVPFLDHNLVQHAWSLPSSMKVRGKETKAVLKDTVRGLVPEECIVRPKRGFPTPLGIMLRGELRPFVRDILLDRRTLERGYIAEGPLRRLIDQHTRGQADHQKVLWPLMVLEMWHRCIAERGGPGAVVM